MNLVVKFLFIIFFIFLSSCSKEENKISIIKEDDIQIQMIEAYKEVIGAIIKLAKKAAKEPWDLPEKDEEINNLPSEIEKNYKNKIGRASCRERV